MTEEEMAAMFRRHMPENSGVWCTCGWKRGDTGPIHKEDWATHVARVFMEELDE